MTYEELKAAYEAAMQKCSELEKENDELKKSNEDQALHIEHLEEQILKRNKMLFGRSSEKSKFICDGQMDLDGNVFNEAEELSNLSAAEPTEESVTKKSKKTGKHRGRNELRNDLETREIVHTLPEDQRRCLVCGGTLVPFSKEYITSRLCVIPAKIVKISYFREVYKCPHCDKHGDKAVIVKAPNLTPAPVIPKGLPEAEMIAYIAEAKYLLGEPLYRMEQHFKMQGIYLNRTSLANWIIKSSKWLEPVVAHFWKYAYLEPVMNADETTLRVLKIEGKPVKKKGQMWVVCTGAAAKLLIAIYTYRDSRSKVTAEELLGNYTGFVQTDGLQSYGSGEYKHAGCWSHARRKFVDSIPENNRNSKAAQAVEIIDRAFALEAQAKKDKLPPEQLLKMRQEEVKPITEEFYSFIGTLRPSKGSHLSAATTYAQNQKDKLLLFLDHPELEMTNNLAERTVKPFVIDRKNFLFSATDKGADASALFMSVIETAKRNGLNVFGYLTYLMLVLPSWGNTPTEAQLDSIMPWSTTLPETCFKNYNQIIENEATASSTFTVARSN